MSPRSWFVALVVMVVVALGARADAQVFKPRGGAKTTAKTPAKKPAADKASTSTAAPAKKKVARKAPAKKSRVATKARPSDLTPDDKKKSDVEVEDEEDDVIIRDEE